MNKITLGQIGNDKQFHFNSRYDEEHELFHDIKNSWLLNKPFSVWPSKNFISQTIIENIY